jgi:hypothetical protein
MIGWDKACKGLKILHFSLPLSLSPSLFIRKILEKLYINTINNVVALTDFTYKHNFTILYNETPFKFIYKEQSIHANGST